MRENNIEATFICPQFRAEAAELAVLGITVRSPRGVLKPRTTENGRRLVEIGAVIVRQERIDVLPRSGLSAWHMHTLFGAAERAFHTQPCEADGWRYTRDADDPRWVTWVSVSAEGALEVSEAVDRSDRRPSRLVA